MSIEKIEWCNYYYVGGRKVEVYFCTSYYLVNIVHAETKNLYKE